MKVDFPKDRAEFMSEWSMAAGESTSLSSVLVLLEKKAATAYIARKDDIARELRDAAQEVKAMERVATEKLQAYIEEDRRRDYCKQKGINA